MADDWSREEVEATVADYFAMLAKELAGVSYNKADHNRRLQPLLASRSKGAIEFKHQNISAVLIELGYPYIDGYKPRSNYQELLREVAVDRLEGDHALASAARTAVTAPMPSIPEPLDWDSSVVPAPSSDVDRAVSYERRVPAAPIVRHINYLEQEARNASLGLAGEQYVMKLEHGRLWSAGARRLADRIEHVSSSRGDGLGYDVLSFEPDGRERLIEVKTTRFGAMTPFFASRNEVGVSEEEGDRYRLYRLFRFGQESKLFILPGPLRQSVLLDPVVYRASLP